MKSDLDLEFNFLSRTKSRAGPILRQSLENLKNAKINKDGNIDMEESTESLREKMIEAAEALAAAEAPIDKKIHKQPINFRQAITCRSCKFINVTSIDGMKALECKKYTGFYVLPDSICDEHIGSFSGKSIRELENEKEQDS